MLTAMDLIGQAREVEERRRRLFLTGIPSVYATFETEVRWLAAEDARLRVLFAGGT